MTNDELRTRMADYLDELLDEEEAEAVEKEIARHPVLLADVARMRAVLYRPYAVDEPSSELPQRIRRRAADRPAWRIARYAAVFVAGVLSALLVRVSPPESVSQEPEITRELSPPPAMEAPHEPRRIR